MKTVFACWIIILNGILLQSVPLYELQAQESPLFAVPERSLTTIPKACTDIEVDEEGNLYLLQTRFHKLSKLYANRSYDSIQTIGGKGIGGEGFNQPNKVLVQNRQNVYVLDYQNRRIVLLNTNLKVTREINFLDLQAGPGSDADEEIFPVSFAAATSGELFLLNQNNLKICKLDIHGKLENIFGGLDYGAGSLKEPVELQMDDNNYLYVSDTSNQLIQVYDLYGVFQYTLRPEADFRWNRFVTFGDYIACFNKDSVYMKNLVTKKYLTAGIPAGERLTDMTAETDHFYLLFADKVNIYRLNPEKH